MKEWILQYAEQQDNEKSESAKDLEEEKFDPVSAFVYADLSAFPLRLVCSIKHQHVKLNICPVRFDTPHLHAVAV